MNDTIINRVNNLDCSKIDKNKFPETMKLELCGICNHKCSYCVVPTLNIKNRFMNDDVFYKSLEEADRLNFKEIGLSHMGEGTLHPKFNEYIKFIHKTYPKFRMFISTNGTQLEQMKVCIENNVNCIKFSLNGYNEEMHNTVTGVKTFDIVIDNLKKLVEYRNEIGSKTEIAASSIYYNCKEQDDFGNMISSIVDSYYYTQIYNHANKKDNKYVELTSDPRIIKHMCDIPCYGLYKLCQVKVNGDINICRFGVDDEFTIGNIMNDKLEDIWYSERAKEIRHKSDNHLMETCNKCVGIRDGL